MKSYDEMVALFENANILSYVKDSYFFIDNKKSQRLLPLTLFVILHLG